MARRTRPVPDAAATDQAATAIYERRRKADDPDLERLPDDADGLLRYVCQRQRVDPDVLQQDALAGLTIVTYLRAELDRGYQRRQRQLDAHELALLRTAQATGLTLAQIAEALGMASRQAVEALLRRLESAEHGGPKMERAGRRARAVVLRGLRQRRRREAWVRRNAEAVRQLTLAVLRERDRLPAAVLDDQGENLYELDRLVHDPVGSVTPGWTALLRLVLAALIEDPGVPRIVGLTGLAEHGRRLLATEPVADTAVHIPVE